VRNIFIIDFVVVDFLHIYPKRSLFSDRNLYSGTSRLRGAGPLLMRPLPS